MTAATGPTSATTSLAGRFRLDEDKGRAWLDRIIAAYPGEAEDISQAAATISAAWYSRSPGAEWTAERLVRGAVEDGILICPDGMDVHFVYESSEDQGWYHFAVDIGHDVATQVRLTTLGADIRKLGSPDATGIEAALSVLAEAVIYSNKALANLALLLTAQDARARGRSRRPVPPAADHRAATTWACPGCGTSYPQNDPDLIVAHAGDCDYVDGAGQPYDVTIKWSVMHWYVATVTSPDLADAAGARPFTALTGHVLDDDDDPDAALPTYLDELTADCAPEKDGWEISRLYAAQLHQPSSPKTEAAGLTALAAEATQLAGEQCSDETTNRKGTT